MFTWTTGERFFLGCTYNTDFIFSFPDTLTLTHTLRTTEQLRDVHKSQHHVVRNLASTEEPVEKDGVKVGSVSVRMDFLVMLVRRRLHCPGVSTEMEY